jgi:hypothetical protein
MYLHDRCSQKEKAGTNNQIYSVGGGEFDIASREGDFVNDLEFVPVLRPGNPKTSGQKVYSLFHLANGEI